MEWWGGATDRERVSREGAGRKTVRRSTQFGGTIEEGRPTRPLYAC
jgi:hypothetical protein